MKIVRAALIAASLLVPGCKSEAPGPRQLVLHNGKIFTADIEHPWAQAVLIRGDRIGAVGTNEEVMAAAGADVPRLDLGGKVVVPGFNDAHDHISPELPAIPVVISPDPVADPTFAQVADSLRAAVARAPKGARLRVTIAEKILSDPRARRAALDRIAPENPVELVAWSGHGSVLNSLALSQAGIADSVRDPLGGRYERDGAGRLTGLMEEYAGFSSYEARTPRTDAGRFGGFCQRGAEVIKWGTTSIQDMATGVEPARLARIVDSLDLPVRLRLIKFPLTNPTGRLLDPWKPLRSTRSVDVSGIKYVLDGTPVERLAVFKTPYSDRADWRGRLNFPPDTLKAILSEALAAKEQPIIHAVGDSAVSLVLTTLASLAPDSVWRQLRPRIEHGEGLTPDQFDLARRLGVVIVQNPAHLALGPSAALRYGPRMTVLQPLKSLGANGIMLALGSDGPLNPFLNIMLAVIHPDNPPEALTVEEAVRAYTLGSAYAEHRNLEKGALVVGMQADLAVLSQDIFTIPPPQIPATVSLLTLKGGVAVHDPNRWTDPLVIAKQKQ